MITSIKKLSSALLLLLLFVSTVAQAQFGLFGPKSYDDCILENMRGVTSDAAARAIVYSCHQKFSSDNSRSVKGELLSQDELSKLSRRGSRWNGNVVILEVHNGTRECVTDLVYRITTWNKSDPNSRLSFDIEFAGTQIQPLSVSTLLKTAGNPRDTFSTQLLSGRRC